MKKYHFARMTDRGQLALPLNLRNLLKLDKGDELEFYLEDNQIVMKKVTPVSLQGDFDPIGDEIGICRQNRGMALVTTDHDGYCESKDILRWRQTL